MKFIENIEVSAIVWIVFQCLICCSEHGLSLEDFSSKPAERCHPVLSSNLYVISNTLLHQSQGKFACLRGELFFSNSTKLISPTTRCLATSKWSGEGNIQCWRGPQVSLVGRQVLPAGESAEYCCDYISVVPLGNTSIYLYHNKFAVLPKGQCLNVTFKPGDNSEISCQAITPYTKLFNNSGRSAVKTIQVLYAPYQLSGNGRERCIWMEGIANWCNISYLVNPSINLRMNLTKNGVAVLNDASPAVTAIGEQQLFHFKRKWVTLADNGSYVLSVAAQRFRDKTLFVEFDVVVRRSLPIAAVIGLIVGMTTFAALATTLIVCVHSKHQRLRAQKLADGRLVQQVHIGFAESKSKMDMWS